MAPMGNFAWRPHARFVSLLVLLNAPVRYSPCLLLVLIEASPHDETTMTPTTTTTMTTTKTKIDENDNDDG